MAIRFRCICGQALSVPDEQAGRQVRCSACSQVVIVPSEKPVPTRARPSQLPPPPPRRGPHTRQRDGKTSARGKSRWVVWACASAVGILLLAAVVAVVILVPNRESSQPARPGEPSSPAVVEEKATMQLSPVAQGGKWGYIDRSGKVIVNYQYDRASPFSEGLAFVSGTGRSGYIDCTGRLRLCRCEDGGPFSEALARVKIGKKWGYVNKAGTVVIRPRFDEAGEFGEGLAPVKSNFQWRYIDGTGKVAVQPKQGGISWADTFSEGLARVKFELFSQWNFLDREGKPAFSRTFDGAGRFAEGLAPVKVGNLWGYIDSSGKFVIKACFGGARSFREGLACAATGPGPDGEKWGYIDRTGKYVIQPRFSRVRDFSEGLAAAKLSAGIGGKSGNWCYIDKTGNVVIRLPQDTGDCLDFCGGLARVRIAPQALNYRWGYIDRAGEFVWSIWEDNESGPYPTGRTF